MPLVKHSKNNFTTGEVSPAIYVRSDLQKYAGACKEVTNAIVRQQGGVEKRPGTELVDVVAGKGQLYNFSYSSTESYALFFFDDAPDNTEKHFAKMRIYVKGAPIYIDGGIYEIETPYYVEDIDDLSTVQSGDVLYIANSNYRPHKLVRKANDDWEFSVVSFIPEEEPVVITGATHGGGLGTGPRTIYYKVAAVDDNGGAEGSPSAEYSTTIPKTWTSGGFITLTWNQIAGHDKYEVYKSSRGFFGWIGSAYGTEFIDDNIDPDVSRGPKNQRDPFIAPTEAVIVGGSMSVTHLFDNLADTTSRYAYTPQFAVVAVNQDGVHSSCTIITCGNHPKKTKTANTKWTHPVFYESRDYDVGFIKNEIAWSASQGGTAYYFVYIHYGDKWYKKFTTLNSITFYGCYAIRRLGTGIDVKFYLQDQNVTQEVWDTTWQESGAPDSEGEYVDESKLYPSSVAIFQQRLVFGNSKAEPRTTWMSESGDYESMAIADPLRDDSAITATIDSKYMDEIVCFSTMRDILLCTTGGEYICNGGESGAAITPSSIRFVQQSQWGCSKTAYPLNVGRNLVFAERSGKRVRDMSYKITEDSYVGDDITIFAEHILETPIKDWVFQRDPYSCIYITTESGQLLTLTYNKEQDIYAWARHESGDATVSGMVIVRDQNEDDLYFVCNRNGKTTVEWQVRNGECYLDSSMVYNAEEGQQPTDTITGLTHLVGQTVSALADGSAVNGLVVSSTGSVHLPFKARHIRVGVPYEMRIRTVNPELGDANHSAQGMKRTIPYVIINAHKSIGIMVGQDFNRLYRAAPEANFVFGEPPQPYSGNIKTFINGHYEDDASICISQSEPFPCTILSLTTAINVGG